LLKDPFNYIDQHGENDTNNYHRGKRKIKPEVFFFYSYIPRQPAQPMKLITEKKEDDSNNNQDYTYDYNVFSKCIHILIFGACKKDYKDKESRNF